MEQQQKTYGLVTAIALIIGIVIGSGIYFKIDDVLGFTGGNVLFGFLVLTIGASNIIFGGLSLSELAKFESSGGGLAAYVERFMSPALATGYGWFQTYIYIPSVVAVVSWVGAFYTSTLFNWQLDFPSQIGLGAVYLVFFAALNVLSRQLAGYWQSVSTFIKLIPLFIIAIVGLFWAAPVPEIPAGVTTIVPSDVGWGWISGLVPLAFAYEGWSLVVSIAPELKNPARDLSRALIIGPIVILITYLLFFYGAIRILGTSFIMSVGDNAITYALNTLFGERAGNLLLVIIIISILGVVNGMILSGMRLPHALSEKSMLPGKPMTLHPKYQLSLKSAASFLVVTLVWLGIHYVTQSTQLLTKNDVSEIAIVFNYVLYLGLYFTVFGLYRKGVIKNRLTGLVAPIVAGLGSVMVIVGSLISSPQMTLVFLVISGLMIVAGYYYYQKRHS